MFHYCRLTSDNRITFGGGGAVRYYFNRGIDKKYADVPRLYEQLAKRPTETAASGVCGSGFWIGWVWVSPASALLPNGKLAVVY